MTTIAEVHAASVAEFGNDHTHDLSCRTWRGQNWVGACDCTLPTRVASTSEGQKDA